MSLSAKKPLSNSSSVHEFKIDLNLGLDHHSSSSSSSLLSLQDIDTRLRDLHSQMTSNEHSPRPLSGATCSSSTYEGIDSQHACVEYSPPVLQSELADWQFDVCRWANKSDPKPAVLYRKHAVNDGRPRPSPLFKLNRPAQVAELLHLHAQNEQPISDFMASHPSLNSFECYTRSDANLLPKSPKVAPVHDASTEHLPPLAAEEYAMHISRLTYLMRSLQAIESADPGFLSQTRVHLLLDLMLDLEQTFTLPRIDFLRQHAKTVQAMGNRYGTSESGFNCIVGRPQHWIHSAPSVSPNVHHISHMAHAIPRHPHFRHSSADTSRVATTKNQASSRITHDSSILGNKLRPDSGFCAGPLENNSALPGNVQLLSPINSIDGSLGLDQCSSSDKQQPTAYIAPATLTDPKLHPVVGPQFMDVAPALHVANANLSQISSIQSNSFTSRKLRRQPQPGPELSPAPSGGSMAVK
ncbi:hypothetical protein IWW36_003536 [Coemansia brasiliensis]|uniref:Uncharacterized protein n=1 Tax=Coemansia brasiliensis TaxID=2650707 RepID=A0A9W8LZP3_9FUNG|nr:hypothetical protein IWW36_003536 [Coemansia brasiliensis]